MEPSRFLKELKCCDCCSKVVLIAQEIRWFPSNIFAAKPASSVKWREVSGASRVSAGRQGHTCHMRSHISPSFHASGATDTLSHSPACCLRRALVQSCSVHWTIPFWKREGAGTWDLSFKLISFRVWGKKKKQNPQSPSPFHVVISFSCFSCLTVKQHQKKGLFSQWRI